MTKPKSILHFLLKTSLSLLFCFGLLSLGIQNARAEGRHPLSVGLQFGGNSIVYAFNADYDFTDSLRAGAGYSAINKADFILFEFQDYTAIRALEPNSVNFLARNSDRNP